MCLETPVQIRAQGGGPSSPSGVESIFREEERVGVTSSSSSEGSRGLIVTQRDEGALKQTEIESNNTSTDFNTTNSGRATF